MCLVLIEKGYTLKQKDKELGFVATNDRSVKNTLVRIKALVRGDTIKLSGEVYSDIASILFKTPQGIKDESFYMPIKNFGMKKSAARDS